MLDASVHQLVRTASLLAIGASMVLAAPAVQARGPLPHQQVDTVSLAELPSQARTTYRLIHRGGPFPFEKDGTVFFNRERLLPAHARGYYREYTVKTPRAKDRGGRRIVCGGVPPTAPEVCYYTSDHYNSFRKISP